jgi:hypothetical protein
MSVVTSYPRIRWPVALVCTIPVRQASIIELADYRRDRP